MTNACRNESKTVRFECDNDNATTAKLVPFKTSPLHHSRADDHETSQDTVCQESSSRTSSRPASVEENSSVLCLPEWIKRASAQHAEMQGRKLFAEGKQNNNKYSTEYNFADDFDELLLVKVRVAFMIAGQLAAEEEALDEKTIAGGVSDVLCTKRLSSKDIFVRFSCYAESSGQDWFLDDSFCGDSDGKDIDDTVTSLEQFPQHGTQSNRFVFSSSSENYNFNTDLETIQMGGTGVLSSNPRLDLYLSVNSVELNHGRVSNGSSEYLRSRFSLEKYNLLRLQSLGFVLYELFTGENALEEIYGAEDTMDAARNEDNGGIMKAFNDRKNADLMSALNLNYDDDDDASLDKLFEPSCSKKKRHAVTLSTEPSVNSKNLKSQLTSGGDSLLEADLTTCTATLRLSGLPVSLCDLIANLIECTEGQFASNNAYQHMHDVHHDLRLMAFHPKKYLKDIDVSTAATLPLGKHFFGREDEWNKLLSAYKNNAAGKECRAAFISGASGTGKSKLAEKIRDYANETGAYFVGSKFDQLRLLKPFSALSVALNEFCSLIAQDLERDELDNIGENLRSFFGNKLLTLAALVPSLREIVDVSCETLLQAELSGRKRQLEYLLREFIQLVLRISNKHITLFMDDLQWADESSLSFLNSLVADDEMSKGFFILGCYRDDAFASTHAFTELLSEQFSPGVPIVTIHLEGFDRESVNMLVSDTLCLSPRVTRSLAMIVYNITQGNPLFIEYVLMSMCASGLLHLSLSSRRWEWDEDKIQSMEMPIGVVQIMIDNIRKLPAPLQESIRVASCFGSSVSMDVVNIVSMTLNSDLMMELETAVEEGYMRKVGRRYQFTHDRIQQAAYETIDPFDRDMNHFKYGLALSAHVFAGGDDDELLFISVDQVNRGGPACVTEAGQKEVIARLNLSAGEKATKMSDFSTAYQFFDFGISFLPKGHWKSHYELSLSLFQAAVEVSCALGDRTNMQLLTSQIFKFAQNFDDKLISYYVIIDSLGSAGKLKESIDKGYEVLGKLDEEFMGVEANEEMKDFDVYQTSVRQLLDGLTDKEILSSPLMSDPTKMMAMKIYNTLLPYLFLSNPLERNLITLRMVHLTLSNGLCSISPCCIANYGAILATRGDLHEGQRFGKLALSLIDHLDAKDSAGVVYAVIYTQIMCFTEPLQSAIEAHREGYKLGMLVGDLNCALRNLHYYNIGTYLCGSPLSVVKSRIEEWFGKIVEYSFLMWMGPVMPLYNVVLKLIGGTTSAKLPPGDIPSEDEILDQSTKSNKRELCNMIYFYRMFIAYLFNDDNLGPIADLYFGSKNDAVPHKTASIAFVLFEGLVAYRMAKTSGSGEWLARGDQATATMEMWLQFSHWNFQNKLSLLKAERFVLMGDSKSALKHYSISIAKAREHHFVHEEAVACELAGSFHLSLGNSTNALNHFGFALKNFNTWGALAKAERLCDHVMIEMNVNVETHLVANTQEPTSNIPTRKRNVSINNY